MALLWVVMITSEENRPWSDDISFGATYPAAGLPIRSVVRPARIASIEARHAETVGRVSAPMLAVVEAKIRAFLAGPW